jgi:diguanylate cyclase (GGDEF)-like protein
MNELEKKPISSERIQGLFNSIGKLITSSLEISQIMNVIMEQVELFFQPRNWSILRVDPDTEELYFVIAKGLDPALIKNLRLKAGEGIAGQVYAAGKSMLVQDVRTTEKFSKKVDKASGFQTRSIIAVPIVFRDRVLGVIELINTLDERNFTQQELEILETIADFAAIALTNALAYERISWMALHDPLTKLYNFSQLDNLLQRVEKQSYRATEKSRMSDNLHSVVVWIDVDHFKEVNDQFGHLVGDKVLVKVANLLQQCCREDDLAFRVGGDEFLIVVMNLLECNVSKTVERLRKALEQASQNVTPASGLSYGITAGLNHTIKALIKKSDNEMYIQKEIHHKERSGT